MQLGNLAVDFGDYIVNAHGAILPDGILLCVPEETGIYGSMIRIQPMTPNLREQFEGSSPHCFGSLVGSNVAVISYCFGGASEVVKYLISGFRSSDEHEIA